MRCVERWFFNVFLLSILSLMNVACDSSHSNESFERIQQRSDLGVNTGNSILPTIQSVRIVVDGSEQVEVRLGSLIECEVSVPDLREGDQAFCSMEFYTVEGEYLGEVENSSVTIGRTSFDLPSEFVIVANASLFDRDGNRIDQEDYSDRFSFEDMGFSGEYHSPAGNGVLPKLTY